MITGLCRGLKNFKVGDRYVYVTRLCSEASRERGLKPKSGSWYLGIASLIVTKVEVSHKQAAGEFGRRRYVAVPGETPYPPGLAYNPQPEAAASRESCIVYVEFKSCGSASKKVALTPDQSTPEQWWEQYSEYHKRQRDKKLRAAFCKFEVIDGREALAIAFKDAPIMSSGDWEDKTQQVSGRLVQNKTGERLASQIAKCGNKID